MGQNGRPRLRNLTNSVVLHAYHWVRDKTFLGLGTANLKLGLADVLVLIWLYLDCLETTQIFATMPFVMKPNAAG